MKRTYLDYNATTPLDPRVLEAMRPYLTTIFANASSFHRAGQEARHGVERAREQVASELGVEPGDVVFTSGGTESDNLALKGVLAGAQGNRRGLVVSAIEHQAVLHPAQRLAVSGVPVRVVPCGPDGRVDLGRLAEAVDDTTLLVSLMHANNETGVLQPVREAARLAHERGAYLHCDAVQTYGKLPLDPSADGIDLLTLSAHKICGPKGAGALYVRKGIKISAQLQGGHQEKNVRPGTENVAALVGLGEATVLAAAERSAETGRVRALRDGLWRDLRSRLDGVRLNGQVAERLYNTLNVSFEGIDGETLLMNLDLEGICVSTGSACTAGSVEPSHVLLAMGLDERTARSTIRISLGRWTTAEETAQAAGAVASVVKRLRTRATGAGK
ncbi:MAG: Cysteine desulfurase IscS [Candidatus Omnitrophica bacterium]|nr:Cysteine desulfurase IscS [Candidatus Omnitrophota bacterium]